MKFDFSSCHQLRLDTDRPQKSQTFEPQREQVNAEQSFSKIVCQRCHCCLQQLLRRAQGQENVQPHMMGNNRTPWEKDFHFSQNSTVEYGAVSTALLVMERFKHAGLAIFADVVPGKPSAVHRNVHTRRQCLHEAQGAPQIE